MALLNKLLGNHRMQLSVFEMRYRGGRDGYYVLVGTPELIEVLQDALLGGDMEYIAADHNSLSHEWFPGTTAESPTAAVKNLYQKIEAMTEAQVAEVMELLPALGGKLLAVGIYDEPTSFKEFAKLRRPEYFQ